MCFLLLPYAFLWAASDSEAFYAQYAQTPAAFFFDAFNACAHASFMITPLCLRLPQAARLGAFQSQIR